MKKNLHVSLFLALLFLGFLPLAIHLREVFTNDDFYAHKFQRILEHKIKLADQTIKSISKAQFDEAIDLTKPFTSEGFSFQIYEGDSLVFWSDNNIPAPVEGFRMFPEESVIEMQNAVYYVVARRDEQRVILGFILLANNFPYSNKYLMSGVVSAFRMPKGVTVDPHMRNGKLIFSTQGQELLALNLTKYEKISVFQRIVATLFLYLFVICALYYLYWLLLRQESKRAVRLQVVAFSFLVVLLRFLSLILLPKPGWLFTFDPYVFASWYAPSMGDLILNSLVALWLIVVLIKFFNELVGSEITRFNLSGRANVMNAILVIIIIYIILVCESLIHHSSIEYLPLGINELDASTLMGYLAFFLQMLILVLAFIWRFKYRLTQVPFYQNYISYMLQLVTAMLILHFTLLPFDIFVVLFYLLAYPLAYFLSMKVNKSIRIYFFFIALFISTFYTEVFIYRYASQKQLRHDMSKVEELANEHDPVAEFFLEDLSKQLKSDTVLKNFVIADSVDFTTVYDYLVKNYFTGFWKQYEVSRISICNPSHYIYDDDYYVWKPCFSYFDSIVNTSGNQIRASAFYFLNNYTGRISYLGVIPFQTEKNSPRLKVSLFIELESKINPESLGYPELLLDESVQRKSDEFGYSYAKYHRGRLISKSGNYDFISGDSEFKKAVTGEFSIYKWEGYRHLIYQPDHSNLIVLSRRQHLFLDFAVIFSYIFIFNFGIFTLLSIAFQTGFYRFQLATSFRNRLQFYIVAILVFSLMLLTSSTIMFIIRNHHKNQTFILKEKLQSVYVELEHKLSYEDELTRAWSADKYENLDMLLVKFSDVFYSDINIYTPQGDLLATSRGEVFNLLLKGPKIDPEVFYQLHYRKKPEFIHRENIHQLDYLSAYTPFYNHEGKLLAYLNLPYFSKESELQLSITTLSVTIVNIYMVLILITLVVAFLISNQLTRPLELIRNSLSQLKLGVSYETIDYKRHDEIGSLVDEYNRAATELERSVELLAKSERESAWREMAKQIAHEIKNPLTPMRLSVQHLLRAWNKQDENFDKFLQQVSSTLIEQIDALTTIANEFSNFAKMPQAEVQQVGILTMLEKCLQLFSSNQTCQFNLVAHTDEVYVLADRDQLSRVFINIIKNAIQAIPADRDGEINIEVSRSNKLVEIAISDNGTGIEENIHGKLFQPNFTTKNSGMGLGLAIAKKTVEQFEGDIRFHTQKDVGTTFIIELPAIGS